MQIRRLIAPMPLFVLLCLLPLAASSGCATRASMAGLSTGGSSISRPAAPTAYAAQRPAIVETCEDGGLIPLTPECLRRLGGEPVTVSRPPADLEVGDRDANFDALRRFVTFLWLERQILLDTGNTDPERGMLLHAFVTLMQNLESLSLEQFALVRWLEGQCRCDTGYRVVGNSAVAPARASRQRQTSGSYLPNATGRNVVTLRSVEGHTLTLRIHVPDGDATVPLLHALGTLLVRSLTATPEMQWQGGPPSLSFDVAQAQKKGPQK